jgi:hypothetical protein
VVRGGITLGVRFGFNDAAAEAKAGEFTHDNFADEKAREGDGIRGQFRAAEAADGD